ncbi:MAG: hypothetical protein L0216_21940 [Planctomycetales bacterium]|nr:hypothetical protein [Planctomycetales bacterium]
MGLFRDLFSRPVTLRDLKVALLRVERERRKKQLELRTTSERQGTLIEEAKRARKSGSDLELDYVWEEVSQVRTEQGFLRRELRVLNLEGIGLKRYVRGMERLQREKNPGGVKKLIERIRRSDLDTKLAAQNLREREYLDELGQILEDAGLELEEIGTAPDDPAKAKFVADLDEIVKAEDAGKSEVAAERAASLRTRLEREAEGMASADGEDT